MFRSFRRKIAAIISPALASEAEAHKEELGRALKSAVEAGNGYSKMVSLAADLERQVLLFKSANADLSKRLGDAATAIAAHQVFARRKDEALREARLYVLDELDALSEALDKMSKKSKRYSETYIMMTAIKADLDKIDAALVTETSAVNGNKVSA